MMTTDDFARELKIYDSEKNDIRESAAAVVHRHGRFHFDGNPINVSGTALRQMCGHRGIPVEFFTNVMTPAE